ncbi:MAG: hypothetical protein AAGC93_11375 [Cyanobacteria bacterium P01_F01_bin.53]
MMWSQRLTPLLINPLLKSLGLKYTGDKPVTASAKVKVKGLALGTTFLTSAWVLLGLQCLFPSAAKANATTPLASQLQALAPDLYLNTSLDPSLNQVLAQSPVPSPEPSQPQAAPTVRYARGENVDLAEIVSEWRSYYDDVPVYLCVCQDNTCNQTEEWPFREYDQYQLSVALGPTNGMVSEAAGFSCVDIADGSRPSNPREFTIAQNDEATGDADNSDNAAAPVVPTPPTATQAPAAIQTPPDASPQPSVPSTPAPSTPISDRPVANGAIPTAIAINDGAAIQLDWPSGASNVLDVAGSNWNINILDALDCESLSLVDQKMMEAQRVVGEPVVDGTTGNVAVPVLLSSCVETDQSALFVIDPNEGGGYALYRAQLVGDRDLPNEFSSYAFSSIRDLRYWDGSLLVRQDSASGAEAVVIFRPSQAPAGTYAGCAVVTVTEGANVLCP